MTAVRPRRGPDSRLNLSSNELRHPGLAGVLHALLDGFDPATLAGYPEQRRAVEAGARLFGVVDEEGVVLGAGSDGLLRLLQAELHDTFAGRLVLQVPNYEAWSVSRGIARWTVDAVRTPPHAGTLTELMLPHLAAARPSLVVVSWPNGPAGYLPPLAELGRLRDACAARGHLLVVDGCYAAFAHPDAPWELARLAGPACLVLLSWSKMFGLAGGRLAMAIGDPAITRRLRLHRQEDHVNAVMLHVMRRTELRLAQYRTIWRDIAAERERIRAALTNRHGLPVPVSGGNFLHLPMPSPRAARELTAALDRAGYRVRNMLDTVDLTDHVRFTVTGPPIGAGFLDTLDRLLTGEANAA